MPLLSPLVLSVARWVSGWLSGWLVSLSSEVRFGRCHGWLIGVLTIAILGTGAIAPPPALAVLRQVEEAPGQVVYQSRQSLRDRDGHTWQVIAFQRLRPNGERSVYLRLVGFPGVANIDRSQPLTITTSLGQTLTAADASRQIFTDASRPEPHVGQYDLDPIVAQLPTGLPLRLSLSMTNGHPVVIDISPALVQEWQAVLQTPQSDS